MFEFACQTSFRPNSLPRLAPRPSSPLALIAFHPAKTMARLHSKPVIEEITDKEEYFEKLLDAYHGDAVEMMSSAAEFLQRKGRLPKEIAQEMTNVARGAAGAGSAGVRTGFLGSSKRAANGVQSNMPDKVHLSCCFLDHL